MNMSIRMLQVSQNQLLKNSHEFYSGGFFLTHESLIILTAASHESKEIPRLYSWGATVSYLLNDFGLRLQRSQPFSRSCSAFWERRVVAWT